MFLNKTRFKKWIKDAYNNGRLRVGQIYGGLVVCGGGWVTWTETGYVPNWVKAAVTEKNIAVMEMLNQHDFEEEADRWDCRY